MSVYILGGKRIRSFLGLPSGTVAINPRTIELLANLIPDLGFITTKSISALPWKGHKPPIFAHNKPYSGINAVGLDNPGAKAFAQQLSQIKLPEYFYLLVSIFGATPEEFVDAATPLLPYANGFELNFSCPHSDKFGLKVGENLDLAVAIIKAVVALGKPVFIKLSPRMDIESVVNQTKNLGIAGYTAINTDGPNSYELFGKPVLTNKLGGFSGRSIRQLALKCIKIIRANTSLPIIGCGGISTGSNILDAIKAGANFCAIGTACAGMSTAKMIDYFRALSHDLENKTRRAERIVRITEKALAPAMKYCLVQLTGRTQLAPDLFVLRFNKKIDAGPGQFIFVWIPGIGERPFSILDTDPLCLLIQARGECTNVLNSLKTYDHVYVRGPYGNVPKVHGKLLLVAGGTGVAGLYLFAKKYGQQTLALIGAKDHKHLYFKPFYMHSTRIYPITENSYHGTPHGLVTGYLAEIIRKNKPDFCLNCGPEGMIRKAVTIEKLYMQEERILSSIESYTACGVRICGRCATLRGLAPCVDGTFMTPKELGL